MKGCTVSNWLLVGLGNPGPTYVSTRHNIGFWFLNAFIEALACDPLVKKGASALTKKVLQHPEREPETLWLMKPLAFMNRSGPPVAAHASFYKIPPERIIVVHDDLDLPVGKIRYKIGGGHAGHNGLKSLDQFVSSGYRRLRIGIGRPATQESPASYVLNRMPKDEKNTTLKAMDKIIAHWPQLFCEPFNAGPLLTAFSS